MEWEPTIETTEDFTMEDVRKRREMRRAARRRRERRQRIVMTVCGITAALAIGVFLGAKSSGSREPMPSAPDPPSAKSVASAPTITHTVANTAAPLKNAEWAVAETPAPEPEPQEAPAPLLESVPLDAETQLAIYDLCGRDNDLFCAVMAMAWTESRFTPDAVGDEGRSVGMMQINTRYHTERMERLGVTDLTDPVQCVAVALDYLKELRDEFGWIDGHAIYMAYNAGPNGARGLMQAGTYSTAYSRDTLALRESYIAEIGGAA